MTFARSSVLKIKINEFNEVIKALIATPESRRVKTEILLLILEILYTRKVTAMAPAKAKIFAEDRLKKLTPDTIIRPIVAPRDAPAETPIIYGSAIGFLKMPWKITPALARAIPTNMDKKILGNLISVIIFKLCGLIESASIK
jgi:hypothetical protein